MRLLPTPGRSTKRLDAKPVQLTPIADSRAHQNRGRVDSPGRQGDAPGLEPLDDTTAFDLDAAHPATFDDHAMDIAMRSYGEIEAMPSGSEIADCGRDTDPVATIARPGSNPRRLWIVVIPDLRITHRTTCAVEGAVDRLPGVGLRPFDPDGPAGAVEIPTRVAIVLELAIKRQNLAEAPFGVAPGFPFIEILRRSAKSDMSVYG